MKPAFKKDGTVTAGNAPGVNDGAAAVVVTSAKRAKELGAQPMVRIVAQATSGVEPKWVMMAPVGAVRKIWEKTGWKNEDVDLYELNEAFSVQALGVMRELGLDPEQGQCQWRRGAIGHPIGASGARVLVTLIYEMIRRNVHRGIAALCLGWRERSGDGSGAVELLDAAAAGDSWPVLSQCGETVTASRRCAANFDSWRRQRDFEYRPAARARSWLRFLRHAPAKLPCRCSSPDPVPRPGRLVV